MTPVEHYLAFKGWVRSDEVGSCWEREDLVIDLDDPDWPVELARLEGRPVRAVMAEVMAFAPGGVS